MIISFDQYQNVIEKSILSFLTTSVRESVLQNADIVIVETGGTVPRGPTPSELFILLEGEVIVYSSQGAELFQSKPGKSFELDTLLSNSKVWKTRWHCEKRSRFLKVSWSIFANELQKNTHAFRYLSRISQSVQLQKLKRDMRSLNVPQDSVVELISAFSEENFELIFSDWSRKAFLTILKGEVSVSVRINNEKRNIATFQVGDSCYLDLENSDFVYEASPGGLAFVIYENQWSQLKNQAVFEEFLNAYRPSPQNSDEATVIAASSPLVKTAGLKVKAPAAKSWKDEIATSVGEIFSVRSSSSSRSKPWLFLNRGYRHHVVIQDDEMRSGSAALATVARCLGHPIETDLFENKFPIHSGAKSLESLKSAAEQFHFSAQVHRFESMQNLQAHTPVIVPFTEKFVTVFEVYGSSVLVGDPESGQVTKMPMKEFARRLVEPKFLSLQANGKQKRSQEKGVSYLRYFSMLLPFWWPICLYFGAGILSYFAELAAPFLDQYIFDSVIPNMRKDLLGFTTVLTVMIILLGALMELFNQSLVSRLKQALSIRLTSMLHAQIFKAPAAYFKRGGFSAIIGRLSEVDTIVNFTASNTLSVVLSLILAVFSYGILWLYNPFFVAVVFVMVPLQMCVIRLLSKKVIDRKIQASVLKSRENGLIFQHFRSPDNSRIVNGNVVQRWQYEKNAFAATELTSTQLNYDVTFSLTNFFCGEMVRIVIVLMSGYMYIQGQMSLGKVLAISLIVPKVNSPIQQIFQSLYSFLGVKASIRRLDHFFLGQKEMMKIEESQKSDVKLKGDIFFNKVSYKYESTAKNSVVDAASFRINSGEFIVVVGPSGSGKTTLAGLLGHLLVPNSGQMFIDGQDSASYSLSHLRREIGYVEQEGSAFSGTFQQNIAMWSENAPHEKVSAAAKIADIDDFILSCKDGYATEVGSLGSGVSEGQKQRLLIARAVFANPSMLILDESTSHLDPISEERVLSRLIDEFRGKTFIFFTQRIHLASRADRIFYMENGRIAEIGSHEALIGKRGKYYDFFCDHLALG